MRTVRTPLFLLSGCGPLVEVVLALDPVNGLLAHAFQRTGRTLCVRTVVLVLPAVAGVLLAFARVVEVADLLANGAKLLAASCLAEGLVPVDVRVCVGKLNPVLSSSRQSGGRLLTVHRGLIALLDGRVWLSVVTAGGDAGHRGLRTRGGVASCSGRRGVCRRVGNTATRIGRGFADVRRRVRIVDLIRRRARVQGVSRPTGCACWGPRHCRIRAV